MQAHPDEARRAELLDELERIVLAEGFARLRVGALASRLHCSRSTLYALAPSKNELIKLVFERWVTRAIDAAKATADERPTLAEKITRFTEMIGVWQATASPEMWRDIRDVPEIADIVSASRGRGKAIVRTYLDEGIAAGTFRPANTAFVAHVVWMAGAASRDPDLLAGMGISVNEALEEIGKLVVYGMQAE